MIKDIQQKLKAVRYCVALGLVPYMEVVVRYSADTAKVPSDITDIDVLGIEPAGAQAGRKIFFDCKSGQKMSAINRALWAGGLKGLVGADEGFVILGKAAPHGHRLAGNSIGIRLFSEPLFDIFATAASVEYSLPSSYLEKLEVWDSLVKIREHFPRLRDFVTFLLSQAPLEENAVSGLRTLISHIKRIEGELDPSKASHRALFCLLIGQALIYLSEMARTFHNVFDPNDDLAAFETSLRYFVWGGRDAYDLRQKLNVALKSARGHEAPPPFDLPGWPSFVELFRSFLDAPFLLGEACLPIKDLAFRELATQESAIDAKLAVRFSANNRIRQYSAATASYIIQATRLPREFKEYMQMSISTVLTKRE